MLYHVSINDFLTRLKVNGMSHDRAHTREVMDAFEHLKPRRALAVVSVGGQWAEYDWVAGHPWVTPSDFPHTCLT